MPSANTRPAAENTFRLASPVTRAPIGVLLPVTVVAPVVAGAVAGSGISGPVVVVPGAVAPSRKKPEREPTKPYDPMTSPLPEHVRACNIGASNTMPISTAITVVKCVPFFIDNINLLLPSGRVAPPAWRKKRGNRGAI